MKKFFSIQLPNLKFIKILVLIMPMGIIFLTNAAGQNEAQNSESAVTPYVAVEEMPMYPGGNTALVKYISKNVRYPESAMINGIQGKVIIKFCVTAQGTVSMISVLKGIDTALDNEAVRIIKTIPNFIPGKKAGIPVPVWYMVPITFSIQN